MYFGLGFLLGFGVAFSLVSILMVWSGAVTQAQELLEEGKEPASPSEKAQFIEPISIKERFNNARIIDDILTKK